MLRQTKLNSVKHAAATTSYGGVLKTLATISSKLTFCTNPEKEAHRTTRMGTPMAMEKIGFKADISLPIRAGGDFSLFVME
ncbi:hypothetical protein [Rhizobium lusitanum]|uniref:hypothetical protein n=1 Tax=Rhizobium lusitanum TaxID=293958 RepID=UPI001FDAA796|nr:hypothetical protein [Rhizobium lusitanum]